MRKTLCFFLIFAWSLAIRLPALVNSGDFNSDHAVVGLQAKHIQQGEWSFFLWGTDYQASFEPLVTAVFNALNPNVGLNLMLATYLAYLIAAFCIFLLLEEVYGTGTALAATLAVVALPFDAFNQTLHPPRFWSIATVFACLLGFEKSRRTSKSRPFLLFLCSVGIFFSLYVDFFAIIFFVPLIGMAAASAMESTRKKDLLSCVSGATLGALLLAISRTLGPKRGAPLAFSFKAIPRNGKLLLGDSLPSVLGFPLQTRSIVDILQFVSAGCLLAFAVFGTITWIRKRKILRSADRLALFALATIAITLVGYLGSPFILDRFSSRYLVPIIWSFPFLIAALLAQRYSVIPLLFCFSIFSWIDWRDTNPSHGFLPIQISDRARATEELALRDFLRSRGITYGFATYWQAFRLTLLFDENPILTPKDRGYSRYPAYWEATMKQKTTAEIATETDPIPSHVVEEELRREQKSFEKYRIGFYDVYLVGSKPLDDKTR